jgi:hypothetical protein
MNSLQGQKKPLVTRPRIEVDDMLPVKLSEIVSGVKAYLKPVSHEVKTEIVEANGQPFTITLTALIKVR